MRYLTPFLAVSLTAALAAQGTERIDTDAIAKIRDEGLNRSQVMETLFWLTDAYGPRLTGSPAPRHSRKPVTGRSGRWRIGVWPMPTRNTLPLARVGPW